MDLSKKVWLLTLTLCNMETSIYKILQVVCDYYGVESKYILGTSRKKVYSRARHLYCYISREFTNESLVEIGKYINRDHATVSHSENKIRIEKELYKDVKKSIEEITSKIFYMPIVIKEVDLLRISENNLKSLIN